MTASARLAKFVDRDEGNGIGCSDMCVIRHGRQTRVPGRRQPRSKTAILRHTGNSCRRNAATQHHKNVTMTCCLRHFSTNSTALQYAVDDALRLLADPTVHTRAWRKKKPAQWVGRQATVALRLREPDAIVLGVNAALRENSARHGGTTDQ